MSWDAKCPKAITQKLLLLRAWNCHIRFPGTLLYTMHHLEKKWNGRVLICTHELLNRLGMSQVCFSVHSWCLPLAKIACVSCCRYDFCHFLASSFPNEMIEHDLRLTCITLHPKWPISLLFFHVIRRIGVSRATKNFESKFLTGTYFRNYWRKRENWRTTKTLWPPPPDWRGLTHRYLWKVLCTRMYLDRWHPSM